MGIVRLGNAMIGWNALINPEAKETIVIDETNKELAREVKDFMIEREAFAKKMKEMLEQEGVLTREAIK